MCAKAWYTGRFSTSSFQALRSIRMLPAMEAATPAMRSAQASRRWASCPDGPRIGNSATATPTAANFARLTPRSAETKTPTTEPASSRARHSASYLFPFLGRELVREGASYLFPLPGRERVRQGASYLFPLPGRELVRQGASYLFPLPGMERARERVDLLFDSPCRSGAARSVAHRQLKLASTRAPR